MKKIIVLSFIVCCFISLTGCIQKKEESKIKPIDYLQNKYGESFEFLESASGEGQGGAPSRTYLTNGNIAAGEKILVTGSTVNKVTTYSDTYIALLKMQNVKEIISKHLAKYYDNSQIYINVYKSVNYSGTDKNVSVENFLSNQLNGLRIILYIKSSDDFDSQTVNIKNFLNDLKSESIFIDTFYFAFLNDDFSFEKVEDNFRYEYMIDGIARNKTQKDYIKNQYLAYWLSKEHDYNYVAQ